MSYFAKMSWSHDLSALSINLPVQEGYQVAIKIPCEKVFESHIQSRGHILKCSSAYQISRNRMGRSWLSFLVIWIRQIEILREWELSTSVI